VLLWDVSDPARPRRLGDPLTGHTEVVSGVAFAPDGHTLATASSDQTVLLWDVSDPARPHRLGDPLPGHTEAVSGVAFAPDGHTLATASSDQTVLLWDVGDPARPRRLGDPLPVQTNQATIVDPPVSVAFAADGHTLATAGGESAVLWDLSGLNARRADPFERACSLSGGGLDPDGWGRSVPDLPYVVSCPR
jgi:WD40 repeat protein